MSEFSVDQVTELLEASELSPGNRRTLRPFLRKIFEIFFRYGPNRNIYEEALYSYGRIVRYVDNYTDESSSSHEYFESIFSLLEEDNIYWQQALCLRIYFETHAPLVQVMRAKWSDVYVKSNKTGNSPNGKNEFLQWNYSKKKIRREIFRDRHADLIRHIWIKSTEADANKEYWFPSSSGKKFQHIQSVDHVWQGVLNKLAIKYISPRRMRLRYYDSGLYFDRLSNFMDRAYGI